MANYESFIEDELQFLCRIVESWDLLLHWMTVVFVSRGMGVLI
jgi:hypothetical protein